MLIEENLNESSKQHVYKRAKRCIGSCVLSIIRENAMSIT